MSDEETGEQHGEQKEHHLKPWQFKPGVSGNPSGRPLGTKSLKTYVQEMLLGMTDKEKLEYLRGLPKDKIWEMGEGKARQDIEANVEVTTKIVSVDE